MHIFGIFSHCFTLFWIVCLCFGLYECTMVLPFELLVYVDRFKDVKSK